MIDVRNVDFMHALQLACELASVYIEMTSSACPKRHFQVPLALESGNHVGRELHASMLDAGQVGLIVDCTQEADTAGTDSLDEEVCLPADLTGSGCEGASGLAAAMSH